MKHFTPVRIVTVALLVATAAIAQEPRIRCSQWDKERFFRDASPAEVQDCVNKNAFTPKRRKNLATPLHRAAAYTKHPEVVAILIRSGADVTAPAFGILNQQRTPLHFAALYNENPEVIRVLAAAGADPNAGDRYGQTPLYLAMSWKTKHEPPTGVTQALIDVGADPNRGVGGTTPLDLAGTAASKRVLAAAGGRVKRQQKSGLGTLVAGAIAGATAAGVGATAEEAVRVAGSVATGQLPPHTELEEEPSLDADRPPEVDSAEAVDGWNEAEINRRLKEQELQRRTASELRRREEAAARKTRIEQSNRQILRSDYRCIRIEDDGEYKCMDGFVVGNSASGKPLCDILLR